MIGVFVVDDGDGAPAIGQRRRKALHADRVAAEVIRRIERRQHRDAHDRAAG